MEARLLRFSLGIVYLWFGALKLFGISPVDDLIRRTYPLLATRPLYLGLTLFEVGVGLVLISGFWKRESALAVVLHLIGTFGVLFTPGLAFQPGFPFLTLAGEFVVKNVVLMAAALALLFGFQEEPDKLRVKGNAQRTAKDGLTFTSKPRFTLPR